MIDDETLLEAIKISINYAENNNVSLHEPDFVGTNALKYLKNCIETGWVSSSGAWITKFEEEICNFTGAKYAIAVTNGTVGLRLALHCAGVKPNDEVIIPPLSFVATANAVSHLGAVPHFIDIEKNNLGLCPKKLQERLEKVGLKQSGFVLNKETGRKIKAILPVHVFGMPANIDDIKNVADHWGLKIIEDAAEALGSRHYIDGSLIHCGLSGDLGIISFNGNKIITSGGGGMLITNNYELAERCRFLSTTAKINHPWEFNHTETGWNDRMPNLNAALGVSQLENIQNKINMKKILFQKYKENISGIEGVELIKKDSKNLNNNWLINIRFKNKNKDEALLARENLLKKAHSQGIFLRPVWKLLNQLSMYKESPSGNLDIAKDQEPRILSLPSSPQLILKNRN